MITIPSGRIRELNDTPPRADGRYVLYWMQNAQRAVANPALEHAVTLANARSLPVVVGFGLTADYPEANARHFAFLLQGLADVAQALARRRIGFAIRLGAPDTVALALARDAALVVCDRGYLRHQVAWRAQVARRAGCRVVQVEGEVVVPVEAASGKHEYAARTIRPRLHRHWDEYLVATAPVAARHAAGHGLPESAVDLADVPALLGRLNADGTVPPVARFAGGHAEARRRLRRFLDGPFAGYAQSRARPEADVVSHLGAYLHFGQIAPVEIALAAREARNAGDADRAAFLEELIVRRELAINHCVFESRYDSYDHAVPDWARRTLARHAHDARPHRYAPRQLEDGATHDAAWNAAMAEMRHTGYMHNRLRMYWGKKIIEWSASPEAAFETILALNNRWFLDGRDANSYANVGWLFGLHDRPWPERPVFGTVRYLSDNFLRKFDVAAYVRMVETLAAREAAP